jgi:hypothetical protein
MSEPRPIVDNIKNEEDQPKKAVPVSKSIEEIKARSDAATQEAKTRHYLSRDTWVTLAGLILVLLLIGCSGAFAGIWADNEKPYVTSFLNLLSSSVMLIIGYIFGRKNDQ